MEERIMAGYYDRDRQNDAIKPAGTMNHPMTHHGNTAEYQASGIPFIQKVTFAGTQHKRIDFPFVTQWVQVFCEKGKAFDVGFSSVANNKVRLDDDADTAPKPNVWRVKCKSIFISSTQTSTDASIAYIVAGLTNVPADQFPDITALEGVGADATIETL